VVLAPGDAPRARALAALGAAAALLAGPRAPAAVCAARALAAAGAVGAAAAAELAAAADLAARLDLAPPPRATVAVPRLGAVVSPVPAWWGAFPASLRRRKAGTDN